MADKLKDNQDGGGVNASDPQAAGKSIEKIESKEGSGKGKYHGSGDGHMDNKDGSGKMGYTQTWGAGRQNGYAKGASKVNSIMKGAGQEKSNKAFSGYADGNNMIDFLTKKGEEMTQQREDALRNDAVVNAMGQYGDSLALVQNDQGVKAQELYGYKLNPGNVVGKENIERGGENQHGVNPLMTYDGELNKNIDAKQFEGDQNVKIRQRGRDMLSEYTGGGRQKYGGNEGDESRSKRDYEG